MKKCSTCQIEKQEPDFNKNKGKPDGLHNVCRDCGKIRSKKYYNDNTEKAKAITIKRTKENKRINSKNILQIKKHGCSVCHEAEPACMDFHHKDPKTKTATISELAHRNYKWRTIKEEIAKCILLCSNCHRKLHAGLIVLDL